MNLLLLLGFTFYSVLLARIQVSQALNCQGEPGEAGPPGAIGEIGDDGDPGEDGESVNVLDRPPPGSPCMCPKGSKGTDGHMGETGVDGRKGQKGMEGEQGYKGTKGDAGRSGAPGSPGISSVDHPPSSPDTIYLPITVNGKVPRVICQHFRKHAYVPGVPDKWLGWYEFGQSGYLAHHKWLYHTTKFQCPCSLPVLPVPTPKVAEILRRL